MRAFSASASAGPALLLRSLGFGAAPFLIAVHLARLFMLTHLVPSPRAQASDLEQLAAPLALHTCVEAILCRQWAILVAEFFRASGRKTRGS